MGGDQIAIKDGDLDLLYLNPSILDNSMNKYLATDFTNFYGGVNYGYVGYAHTFNKIGNMAFGLMYANYGEFTRADMNGTVQGSFSANETMLHATYARPFGKYFSTERRMSNSFIPSWLITARSDWQPTWPQHFTTQRPIGRSVWWPETLDRS